MTEPAADVGREAIVRLDGRRVGRITETADHYTTTFTYDPDYLAAPDAVPVSLTIALSAEPVRWGGLHPFFQNLLPEGWMREVAVRKFQVAPSDDFGILLATARDCAGAVEIMPAADRDVA